jgi:hypothetical protein
VQNPLSSSLLSKNVKIKIYRTIILSVVLYGCENWSLTLREKCRLRVFENRVLSRHPILEKVESGIIPRISVVDYMACIGTALPFTFTFNDVHNDVSFVMSGGKNNAQCTRDSPACRQHADR